MKKLTKSIAILLSLVIVFSGFSIVSFAASPEESSISPRIPPERQKTKTFHYEYYSPSSPHYISFDVVVTGTYSEYDNTATLYNPVLSNMAGTGAFLQTMSYQYFPEIMGSGTFAIAFISPYATDMESNVFAFPLYKLTPNGNLQQYNLLDPNVQIPT